MCILQEIREENYCCVMDNVPCLFGLVSLVPSEGGQGNNGENQGLAVMGLHVGNPALAFRQRRKPNVKKPERHSAQNSRTVVMDLPPLIVTRLSRK